MAPVLLTRRRAVLAAWSSVAPGAELRFARANGDLSLGLPSWAADSPQAAADAKGVAFGTAVNITSLRRDPRYGPAVARDCGIVVAENEMKMEYVESRPGALTFDGADETAAFARTHGMRLRGTTLVWHRGMPDWFAARITPVDAEKAMLRWIGIIAGRYRGRIESWDVVNEIVDARAPDGLRRTPWLEALGPSYIDMAFHALTDADPHAAGLWNEDDLELGAEWMDQRRATVLRLLEKLLARGVPVRRFGLQSHLNSTIPFDAGKLRRFLAEIASMGLAIEITELDIDDRAFDAGERARDAGVAELTRRYLDVVLDERAVLNVLTWGILDRDTWYNASGRRRPDGLAQRSLPIASDYTDKPMRAAIRRAFEASPDHAAFRRSLRGA